MSSPWSIKKDDFPVNGNLIEKIKFVLGYAILAPSTHNSQPWLFKIKENSCEVYFDQNIKIPESDPLSRDLYISMGCMVENLAIASSYFGILKDIKVNIRDNYIGEVFFSEEGDRNLDLEYLLETIPARVNARGVFDPTPIGDSAIVEMMALNKNGHIQQMFVTGKGEIESLAKITAEGLVFAYKRPSFRKEMSGWIHNSLSSSKTGLLGYSLRMPFIISFLIPTLIRFFDIGQLLAKLNRRSVASSQLICVYSSEKSEPRIWFEIGRLGERCMLHLNSKGIRTSIFVASIEMGDLYKKVQQVLGSNLMPQFLFCVGYMKNVQRHSPRQDLKSKIIQN